MRRLMQRHALASRGIAMEAARVAEIEQTLRVLANANRIHLLLALQTPRRVSEIELPPERPGPWGSSDRAISRQAVLKHLRELMEIGVVAALGDSPHTRYVVNHAKLFELTEQLRELATVRAVVPMQAETQEVGPPGAPPPPDGPRLVLVRGVREGQSFPLTPPAPEGGWAIGRRADAHVPLDYDPYLSAVQARVLLSGERHFLAEEPSRRNATYLNWRPMTRGGIAPLEPGDLVGVGMSLLMYRR